jgi:hypothetical protein
VSPGQSFGFLRHRQAEEHQKFYSPREALRNLTDACSARESFAGR